MEKENIRRVRNIHDANDVGIEFISVFGLPPVDYVAFAEELGCRHISIALAPFTDNPHGYPLWSLRNDAQLRRDLIAAMRDKGVTISLGEGFLHRPNTQIEEVAADLDLMVELGAANVNILSLDTDRNRSFDALATFARMAKARSLQATLEFLPGLPIGDLSSAVAAVRHVGMPHFRLLLDAMHVFRSGATVADLAGLDPQLIGYVQLCDVPLISRYSEYSEEARNHRLPPGEGELPLLDFLAVTPDNVTIGLEVPMLGDAQAGIGPLERMSGCVKATRQLLERMPAKYLPQ